MHKHLKKVIILLLWFFMGLNNIYANNINIKNIEVILNKQEKQILTVPKDIDKKVFLDLFLGCYDKNNKKRDDFDFIFKESWSNSQKPGFGIIRTSKKEESVFCYMKTKNKNEVLKLNIKAKEVKEKKIKKHNSFSESIDISDKFYKKSIQERELSCESSATSDIISTIKGRNISESEVIKKLSKSHYQKTAKKVGDTRYWGNPNLGFVGYIDEYKGRGALQWKYEGYGVYEKPISQVYNDYGIGNRIINKFNRQEYNLKDEKEHLTYILKKLSDGNHIQLWGDICTYPEFEDGKIDYKGKRAGGKITQKEADKGLNGTNPCIYPYKKRELKWYYKNTDGTEKLIKGLNGQHAFYLLGYKGGVENPTDIIVWDTNTGKHTYPTKEWLRKWEKMQYRSIVVYTNPFDKDLFQNQNIKDTKTEKSLNLEKEKRKEKFDISGNNTKDINDIYIKFIKNHFLYLENGEYQTAYNNYSYLENVDVEKFKSWYKDIEKIEVENIEKLGEQEYSFYVIFYKEASMKIVYIQQKLSKTNFGKISFEEYETKLVEKVGDK